MIGIELICSHCLAQFFCCRRCWRGNKYCSLLCKVEARKIKQREYEKKYSGTVAGQESRRKRQKVFREKNKNNLGVTDHSMKNDLGHAIHGEKQKSKSAALCFECGCHIKSIVLRNDSYGLQFKPTQKEDSYFSFTRI